MNSTVIKYRKLATWFAMNSIVMSTCFAQTTFDLSIQFEKLKTTDHAIMVEVFRSDKNLQNVNWQTLTPLRTKTVKLTEKNKTLTIRNLQQGLYALRAFQDLNDNQTLDKTSSGIPKEPVAFSNNPSLFKGEPDLEKTSIWLDKDRSVTIKFKHRKRKKARRKR